MAGYHMAADDPRIEYVGRTVVSTAGHVNDMLKGKPAAVIASHSHPRAVREAKTAAHMENVVVYDWAGVAIEFEVTGTSKVCVDMVGGGNVFVARVDGVEANRFKAKGDRKVYSAVSGLDPSRVYVISIIKITEAAHFVLYCLMPLKPVVIHGFIFDGACDVWLQVPHRRSFARAEQPLAIQLLRNSHQSLGSLSARDSGIDSVAQMDLENSSLPRTSSSSTWISIDTASVASTQGDGTRRIEFIGDSDTNGFGSESKCPSMSLSCFTKMTEMENCTVSFAYRVAETLGARPHLVAWSGKGVSRNAVDLSISSSKLSKDTMLNCCDRAIARLPHSKWDYARFLPNVVVIYLGCNDFYSKPYPTADVFQQAYLRLLRKTVSSYAEHDCRPTIVNVVGGFFPGYIASREHIVAAVTQFKTEYANVHIVSVPETLIDKRTDLGCLEHLNVSGHGKLGAFLAKEIAEIVGWTTVTAEVCVDVPRPIVDAAVATDVAIEAVAADAVCTSPASQPSDALLPALTA
eukprot:Opistho-2@37656